MSASQQGIPKHNRRSSKKQPHTVQNSRSVVSDNDAYTTLTENKTVSGEAKNRSRRKSHASKRGYQNDAAAYSDGSTQRPAAHPTKTQATPIKQQAYAGPTFHQSPAPSALPLPSFYSKSLPIASPLKSNIDSAESPGKHMAELPEPAVPSVAIQNKRESTPLDFLFDAARKANGTPGTESPNHRMYLSSAADTPASRSPAARDGDTDFPFELDSGDQIALDDESNLSTPYKDRIEAIRSQRTPVGGRSLNEDERREKTAALKSYLMSSAQGQGEAVDSNPFNARPAPPHNRQYQHRSSPTTPYNVSGQSNAHQYFPPMPPMPPMPQMPSMAPTSQYQSPSRPGPPSNLRNVYAPGPEQALERGSPQKMVEHPRISTARGQTPSRSNFADIYSTSNKQPEQNFGHRATPSAQQLEDDLRKILKLDLVG